MLAEDACALALARFCSNCPAAAKTRLTNGPLLDTRKETDRERGVRPRPLIFRLPDPSNTKHIRTRLVRTLAATENSHQQCHLLIGYVLHLLSQRSDEGEGSHTA